ncbi:MAG: hypothetical protein IPM24_06885 [Bryobacterales bacterium]|jgi:hypothetical protein|nr:hypothetical protein [Bryobacterales bacterium]
MRKWLIWSGVAIALLLVGLTVAGFILARRIDPFLREQTVAYLQERFASEVELESLSVSVPMRSPIRVLLDRGRGATVKLTGKGLALHFRGSREYPPLIKMSRFDVEADLADVREKPARVRLVKLHGMEITLPPAGARPKMGGAASEAEDSSGGQDKPTSVILDQVLADGAKLTILPRDPTKRPLVWDLHELKLTSAGPGVPMQYETKLTNAKPPGLVDSKGSFGPWKTTEPRETPLSGEYVFTDADLGVFKGIAGKLNSTGTFEGRLDHLIVDGETTTPDFRLSTAGNRVPLKTRFHAIVDGTNGNTLLEPVDATIGRTTFRLVGGVVRDIDETGKTITFDVNIRKGHIDDFLRLAVKGDKPFLRGDVDMKVKLEIPPGKTEIADRMRLAGTFSLARAHFTSPTVADKIDELSQRGQGAPRDSSIAEVPAVFGGTFRLADGRMDFSKLNFSVPGAAVDLKGLYTFDDEKLDFWGTLKLDARVSQTQTGWKRWALKPVDPFFARGGAGTNLRIRISGDRSSPKFGRDK